MGEADLLVSSTRRCCGSEHSRFPRCWRAKCRWCRAWLTKHDLTRQDAIDCALAVGHDCE